MMVNRQFSEAVGALHAHFTRYAMTGMALEAEAVTEMVRILASYREMAEALEDACAERDQLRAIARDLDLIGAETLPPIDLMRLVVERCIAEAGGNVVIFPGRPHAVARPGTGGAA